MERRLCLHHCVSVLPHKLATIGSVEYVRHNCAGRSLQCSKTVLPSVLADDLPVLDEYHHLHGLEEELPRHRVDYPWTKVKESWCCPGVVNIRGMDSIK